MPYFKMMILLTGFLCNSKLENSVLSSRLSVLGHIYDISALFQIMLPSSTYYSRHLFFSLNTSSVVFTISSRVGAIISTRFFNESATQVALFIIITEEGHWRWHILCARWISTARTTTTTIMKPIPSLS